MSAWHDLGEAVTITCMLAKRPPSTVWPAIVGLLVSTVLEVVTNLAAESVPAWLENPLVVWAWLVVGVLVTAIWSRHAIGSEPEDAAHHIIGDVPALSEAFEFREEEIAAI